MRMGAVGRLGDAREVLAQPVLAGPVVVGADGDDAVEGVALEPAEGLHHLVRGVAAHPHEDGHAPRRDVEGPLDDRFHLVLVEGGALPGGPEREDAGHPRGQIVLEQPLVAREVDAAIEKRRDHGQPDTRECPVIRLRRSVHEMVLSAPGKAKGPRHGSRGPEISGNGWRLDHGSPPARATTNWASLSRGPQPALLARALEAE